MNHTSAVGNGEKEVLKHFPKVTAMCQSCIDVRKFHHLTRQRKLQFRPKGCGKKSVEIPLAKFLRDRDCIERKIFQAPPDSIIMC